MRFEFPRAPKVEFNIPKIKVDIPKVNIPGISQQQTSSSLQKMDVGYKKGYDDGYSGSSDLSEGKDTANNEYWLGYSCGFRDGRFDRENGKTATC